MSVEDGDGSCSLGPGGDAAAGECCAGIPAAPCSAPENRGTRISQLVTTDLLKDYLFITPPNHRNYCGSQFTTQRRHAVNQRCLAVVTHHGTMHTRCMSPELTYIWEVDSANDSIVCPSRLLSRGTCSTTEYVLLDLVWQHSC